ncbi:MAG: cobalt transporter CbiM [Candidatus Desulfofervidaceae bacterium]|nr:cobalt transporter CbiM [Candidatus Desulfofervidaceae bacterium]MDL1970479.1 cobalt transporter CbiM [Candidatus Desulfofervidaceae bacterium]
MHISDGILSVPVLVTGAILTAGGTALGLKRLRHETVPQTAILSSAFFVASLIHVPLGPSSVHLILNGLAGIILGWITFPALLIALFLQTILFQFGGLTTLGVNTFNMAFPGVIAYFICHPLLKIGKPHSITLAGILAAVIGISLAGLFVALELVFTGQGFIPVAKLVLVAHVPVIIIEAIITAVILNFLHKAKPEILGVDK